MCLKIKPCDGVALPITGSIDAVPSGLTIGGKVTIVTLTTTPEALPLVALTDRNTLSIQNQDLTQDIIINYVSVFTEGVIIYAGGNKEFQITDSIIIYGRSVSGTAKISIEEIA